MFQVTPDQIDVPALISSVQSDAHGALIVFTGMVRNHHDGREVLRLEYEAYDEMAVAEMKSIASEIQSKWPSTSIGIIHRLGVVPIGEVAVAVVTSAPHRDGCYAANRYAIDQLKQRAPIWKKEVYSDGSCWKTNASTP